MTLEDQFRSALRCAKELEAHKLAETALSKKLQAEFFRINIRKFDGISKFAVQKNCLVFGPYNWPNGISPYALGGDPADRPDPNAFIRICAPLAYRNGAISRFFFGARTGSVERFRELRISYYGEKSDPIFRCEQGQFGLEIGPGTYFTGRLGDGGILDTKDRLMVSTSVDEIERFIVRQLARVEEIFRKDN